MADPIIDSRAMVALSRLLTERNAALRERDAALAQLQADDQRAWEALGKPEGTYSTTNVQRLCEQVDRAKRALLAGGYTDLGGQDWKPPIGPTAAPLLDELDAARADLREAVKLLGSFLLTLAPGELDLHERRIAMLAKHKETP